MFKRIKSILVALVAMTVFSGVFSASAFAEDGYGIGMSPMKESIVLSAGEKYNGSFTIANSANNTQNFDYIIKVSPFYATESYDITYERNEAVNQIVDWITLDHDGGTLTPNSTRDVHFTINVPSDAPAGGQYAAIIVQASPADDNNNSGLNINQAIGVAHTIFAEVMGATKRGGEFISINVPSFLFSGNISGEVAIKNIGNVHGTAKYKLQVFPLFSDEEIYTNEENPETSIILPNRTLYSETVWTNTPMFGIFNVVYTVEYEGVTEQVSKMVIKCPVWMLFLIITVIIVIILYIAMKIKSRKKVEKRC